VIFGFAIGNPFGLLVSCGGWMILDSALIAAALVSMALAGLKSIHHDEHGTYSPYAELVSS
jgi:hypothetical protein